MDTLQIVVIVFIVTTTILFLAIILMFLYYRNRERATGDGDPTNDDSMGRLSVSRDPERAKKDESSGRKNDNDTNGTNDDTEKQLMFSSSSNFEKTHPPPPYTLPMKYPNIPSDINSEADYTCCAVVHENNIVNEEKVKLSPHEPTPHRETVHYPNLEAMLESEAETSVCAELCELEDNPKSSIRMEQDFTQPLNSTFLQGPPVERYRKPLMHSSLSKPPEEDLYANIPFAPIPVPRRKFNILPVPPKITERSQTENDYDEIDISVKGNVAHTNPHYEAISFVPVPSVLQYVEPNISSSSSKDTYLPMRDQMKFLKHENQNTINTTTSHATSMIAKPTKPVSTVAPIKRYFSSPNLLSEDSPNFINKNESVTCPSSAVPVFNSTEVEETLEDTFTQTRSSLAEVLSSLPEILDISNNEESYTCHICSKLVKTRNGYSQHLITHRLCRCSAQAIVDVSSSHNYSSLISPEIFKVQECFIEENKKYEEKAEQLLQSGKSFKCPDCNKKAYIQNNLDRFHNHMFKQHNICSCKLDIEALSV